MMDKARTSQQLKQYISSSSVGESDISNHPPPNGGDDREGRIGTGQASRLLTWSNVNLSVGDFKILKNVWGMAGNEITAVLGPSGAGKTSLLNLLAGRSYGAKKMDFSADIKLDGVPVNPLTDIKVRRQIAFVEQHDTLHIAATPREAIKFSARLRLSATTSEAELNSLTESMIKELGLQGCANTIVGGETLKGISGGERKRAAIGVELVTKPSLLFLDEPTSGLDSFSALQLITVLHKVVQTGASVLMTIHQPASDILEKIDRLVLLRAGRCMYNGPQEQVTNYFADRGYPLPPKYNPADFIMIVAQTVSENDLEEAGFFPDSGDEEAALARTNADFSLTVSQHGTMAANGSRHVSAYLEIFELLRREAFGMRRNKMILGSRLMLTIFMSVLISIVFFGVGEKEPEDQTIIQSQFGALIMTWMIAMFGTALPTLIVFPEERPVFVREYSTNHYSVSSYFISRLTLEGLLTAMQMVLLSILTKFLIKFQQDFFWMFLTLFTLAMSSTAIAMVIGSSVEDPKLAIEFMPMTLVPQILFAGFFIAPDLIPVWLRWLQWVMPLTFAVKIGLENEFNRDCGSFQSNLNCQYILNSNNVNPDDTWWYWLALVGIFCVLRLGALIVLRRKAMK